LRVGDVREVGERPLADHHHVGVHRQVHRLVVDNGRPGGETKITMVHGREVDQGQRQLVDPWRQSVEHVVASGPRNRQSQLLIFYLQGNGHAGQHASRFVDHASLNPTGSPLLSLRTVCRGKQKRYRKRDAKNHSPSV
jgi:hypothetical protein